MIRYQRIGPVSTVDALLVRMNTTEPLELKLPTYTCREDQSLNDKRASAAGGELIFAHQMFPLLPRGIAATPLPPEIWSGDLDRETRRALWCAHMCHGHYEPYGDTRSLLEREGDASQEGLGIFGVDCNPLDSVVALSASIRDTNFLFHFVMVVALQYYLTKRRCFMRVRTDIHASHYSDALPGFIFVMFREADCRVPTTNTTTTAALAVITFENAADCAATVSFPSFLLLVFRWMQSKYPSTRGNPAPASAPASAQASAPAAAASAAPAVAAAQAAPGKKNKKPRKADATHARGKKSVEELKHNASDEALEFCNTKLSKNAAQAYSCMRFREFIPDGLMERIAESKGGEAPRLVPKKFFQV